MKCPNCGKEMALQNNTWVCKECGCSMPAKDCRECPNCGDKMVLRRNALGGEESWVCTYCKFIMPLDGLPANNEDEEESDEESTEFQKPVMYCRFCGAPLVKRPDFCYECGAEQNLPAVEEEKAVDWTCPNCKRIMTLDSSCTKLICPRCGVDRYLDAPISPEDQPAVEPEDEAGSNGRCGHCHALLVEEQNFCPKCGKSNAKRTSPATHSADNTAGAGWPFALPGLLAALLGIIFVIVGNGAPINAWLYQLGYDPTYNSLLDRLGPAETTMAWLAGIGVALMITGLIVKCVKKRLLRKTAATLSIVLTLAIVFVTVICADPIVGTYNYSYSGSYSGESNTNHSASENNDPLPTTHTISKSVLDRAIRSFKLTTGIWTISLQNLIVAAIPDYEITYYKGEEAISEGFVSESEIDAVATSSYDLDYVYFAVVSGDTMTNPSLKYVTKYEENAVRIIMIFDQNDQLIDGGYYICDSLSTFALLYTSEGY